MDERSVPCLVVSGCLGSGGEEAFVELAAGCLCCALNDELYDMLVMLKDQVVLG